jgi:uncharacterized protein YqeY
MSLFQRLQDDLKVAMRDKDELRRETLRMAIAAMKNRKIELMAELSDAEQLAVVQKAVKSRHEAASEYEKAKRPDLAAKEQAEAAVLVGYLPKLLDAAATRAAVQASIAELGLTEKKQLGQLMKAVMAKHPGQVDGKLVNQLAAELLR